ncbi:MAG: FKBP-type peptidyl-prolyl cis-trans isomerase [Nanoarchaeota archaeon]|nr:FKBP-type peptidyl-prolyl cis-trans isomerase [Nanoarchaeota archaeon]
MAVKKNDFIEVEFTGGIIDTDEIFDTNIKADAEKAGLDVKNMKPFVLSVGHKMLPKGLDEDLEGKEIEKSYTLDLNPEDAFGKRNPQMVRMIPTRLFHEQKIDPQRGMQLSLDGQLVKILSSDRGRTLVDFNNPLAGKKVTYKYKIRKTVTDEKEKIDALQEFLFRKKFEFDKEGEVITFKVEKQMEPFVKMFAPKFEEILGLKVESKVVEKK